MRLLTHDADADDDNNHDDHNNADDANLIFTSIFRRSKVLRSSSGEVDLRQRLDLQHLQLCEHQPNWTTRWIERKRKKEL